MAAGTDPLGPLLARKGPNRLSFPLGPKSPHGVEASRRREMHHALFGAEPAELRVTDHASPEGAHVRRDVVERKADYERPQQLCRSDTELVAASDRERQPMPFDAIAGISAQDDICGR